MRRRERRRLGEGERHLRLVAMAFEIDEEDVLPGLALEGPRLDRGQVHAVLRERRQQPVQRAGLVPPHGEADRREVVSARPGRRASKHHEAGRIVAPVFDGRLDRRKAPGLGGEGASDGGDAGVTPGETRGRCSAGGLYAIHPGQMRLEPLTTLGKRLGDRRHALHIRQAAAAREQVMDDAEHDLAADRRLRLDQRIECGRHHALRRVLDGHDGEVCVAALHRDHHIRDGGLGQQLGLATELLARREVAEGPFGSEIGDAQRPFEAAHDADDLAEYMGDRSGRERAGVEGRESREDLPLARGIEAEDTGSLLEPPDLEHEPRALVQSLEDCIVHGIDARTQAREVGAGAVRPHVGFRLRAMGSLRSSHSLLGARWPGAA